MRRILLAALLVASPLFSREIAVIPYKVDNPSSSFGGEKGHDYAKILSIALHAKKGLGIYNPYQLSRDLSGLGINPDKNLSLENVESFAKVRYTDFVVTGKITALEKGFKAESLVYSASRREIVSRSSVKARNLLELAAFDSKELFRFLSDDKKVEDKLIYDVTVVFDSSFNMAQDFDEVKSSLKSFCVKFFAAYPGSALWMLPYSNKTNLLLSGPATSVLSADDLIDKLKLSGGNDDASFSGAFNAAIENTRWRKDAEKVIVIFANSPYKDKGFASRFARRAANKKISVNSVILGRVSPEDSIRYSRLCEMSRGDSFDVTYRQSLYDKKGEPFFLFFEKGRLFDSTLENADWERGLFTYLERKRYGYGKVADFAHELYFKRKNEITPYNMAEAYRRQGDRSVISIGDLSSNIRGIVSAMNDRLKPLGRRSAKTIARVLLTEGNVSVWADVRTREALDFFTRKKDLGYGLPLGVVIQPKKDEAYGFTFAPSEYITDLSGEYIPDQLKLKLSDIIKSPSKYYESGLLKPSLWFVDLKVDEIRLLEREDDIRGN